ncbi:GntR family transcriptional regulator [Glutamicibacter uratoxydans]|uniref:GntR family transcriptional regulator n=1 Tax=Glutamicibacter uratoxydans TaxID=43667 RepID=A0A4Y4DUT9_GLUUR|nr:GntR family transcriptional regulator [Glutamicibacter uratoxydans]GED06181.1 GntR family transcriptional regulator [Glutamicibacter uratoxydans]
MTTTAEIADSESMAERSYRILRDRLIMLDIAPGDPINEAALAADLGTGRTPMREALKRLEIDHLVVSYPRRGTFATGVDVTELASISDVRFSLESLATRRAAEEKGGIYREELEKTREAISGLDSLHDHRQLIEFDLKVHRLIYQAANNHHLEEALVRLDNLATRIWCMVLNRLPDIHQHISEHVTLIDLILAGDSEAAAAMAGEHILNFEKTVRSVL